MLVLFACNYLSPLHKSSERKNHLKPENLGTVFLLSALRMPIESVTNHRAEIKYLEISPLIYRFGNCIFIFQRSNLISLSEIKSFVSFKNESLLFWTRVHFKGGVNFSEILREFPHKEGVWQIKNFVFLGGGLGKKG